MKYLSSFNALAAVVLLALGCACSSEEEPDMSFDGVINTKTLEMLVNETCAYDCIDYKKYEKSNEDYLNDTGEWVYKYEWPGDILPHPFYLENGHLITPFVYSPPINSIMMHFNYAWGLYCQYSGYDKTIAIEKPLMIDKKNHILSVTIPTDASSSDKYLNNTLKFKIHKANDSYLAFSLELPRYESDENGEITCANIAQKHNYIFKKRSINFTLSNRYQTFENSREAQLWMIKTMREYFGDSIDVSKYASHVLKDYIIDLAEMEEWVKKSHPVIAL